VSIRVETIGDATFLLGAMSESAEDVDAALEAGSTCLKNLQRDVAPDLELIFGGSLDVLPRSAAARVAMEAARTAAHAGHANHSSEAARYALGGAFVDQALEAMKEIASLDAGYVVSGECGAFSLGADAILNVPTEFRGGLWLEVVRGVRPGVIKGGIAVAGTRVPESADGDADAVAVYARSAAEAALSAVLIADAVVMPEQAKSKSIPSAEDIWDALTLGVKTMLPLREASMVRAGILALRGRGRLIGSIEGDRLLRFGVSDWR
jgi:hypothetical protein